MPAVDNHPPRFGVEAAERIVRVEYGLAAAVAPMSGERDQNFHVKAASGAQYVLKIANRADGIELLALQGLVMARLHASSVPVQEIIPARTGEPLLSVTG